MSFEHRGSLTVPTRSNPGGVGERIGRGPRQKKCRRISSRILARALKRLEKNVRMGEDPIKRSGLRKEPDWALLEESDDAKNTCQARHACCEVEEVLLPWFCKQWILVALELLQVGLGEEGPDAELGDQLRDALDERLKGGDVPHVIRSLLRPVWLPSKEVSRGAQREILWPNLRRKFRNES